MHIKKRGNNIALLYRSTWVRKNAEGNSHGYSRQLYVGCLSMQSTEIPSAVAAKLTAEERDFLEQQVLQPARRASELAKAQAQVRERDPLWRLDEGLRLIREAAALSAQGKVPASRVREIQSALDAVQVIGAPSRPVERDPLEVAVQALRHAARAVAMGHYGRAPDEGVRKSAVYANWLSISEHVDGTARDGLLRQLQAAAWVKAKAR
jgi:hypothetical protein